MAFSSSNLSISPQYNLTNDPKDFSFDDIADYSAETYTNILGLLKAVDPDGLQFYNNTDYNTPDIDYNSSTSSAALASLPLDSSSLVKNGLYTFTYNAKIEDMLQSHLVLSNNSGAKTFVINDLTGSIAAQITSGTAAAWNIVDTITTAITIVSAVWSSSTKTTTVTINETLGALTSLATFQFTVDVIYTRTFTQEYSYVSPDICLNWVNDECCSSMEITDVSVYETGAVVTRLHTVHYPDGMTTPIADITSPLQELTITPIWTGTWTDTFTAAITATNGIIGITDSARGVKEHKVTGSDGLCQIYTCMGNMATKYTSLLVNAPNKAIEMQKNIAKVSIAFIAYTTGKKCGETDYEQYLDQITAIAASCDCGCDCDDCADGTPVQVVGCCENVGGSDFTILIQSTDGSVSVSSNTVGSTTTFDIQVDGTWLTTQIQNEIAVTTIGELLDVDDTTAVAATGQVLVWNNATLKYERATFSGLVSLIGLNDVDDTGLADQMYMYYDAGSLTFKFRAVATYALNDLTDVTITAPATGQVMKYDGAEWVNIDLLYTTLMDVNATGIVDGVSFKWDSGTSKFIIFTPKLTFESLDDTDIDNTVALATYDRVQFNAAGTTKWENVTRATFIDLINYQGVYSRGVATFFDSGAMFDSITNMVTLRGAIAGGGAVVAPQDLAYVPLAYIPAAIVPIRVTCGLGATNYIGIGQVAVSGLITIYSHYNATGDVIAGIPAGGISLDGISYCPDA
jgi:hypothetical protein